MMCATSVGMFLAEHTSGLPCTLKHDPQNIVQPVPLEDPPTVSAVPARDVPSVQLVIAVHSICAM